MKKNLRNLSLPAGILGVALLLVCASANATTINITVDENGNYSSSDGIIVGSGVASESYFYPDASLLTYYFSTETSPVDLASYVPVEGAVYIYSDAGHTHLADVIVLAPDGPSYLFFMSLGDVGTKAYVTTLPSWVSGLTTIASLTEGTGGITTYTPTGPNGPNAQPGFMDDATVTYTFENTVPDAGSSAMLLGMGVLALAGFRRKFNFKTQS